MDWSQAEWLEWDTPRMCQEIRSLRPGAELTVTVAQLNQLPGQARNRGMTFETAEVWGCGVT